MADQESEQAGPPPGEGDPAQNPEAQAQQQPRRAPDQNATFLRAARAGNLDQVLEFLHNGININTSNSNGLNALHLASKEGHNEVVRELIRRGADVDAATRKGNTALHIASLAGQDIIVTILVENGANVNAQSLNGFTPLYMAAQENHEAVVRYLLAHNANQALATEDGFTPLAVALQQGHDRVVALLLENDNNSKVKLPALHIAAKKDDTRAATLLLQSEQNPNVTSKSGFTPLHIASHYGNENVAQLLIEKGANVNYQARHDISPLHVAAKWGRVNLVKILLQNGALIDCRTRDLLTPLHCAARSGHELVVDLLLENHAPIGAKTKNGLAPLHMASQGDHVDCARNLLYHQAPVDDVTVDYLTPLHVAAHCGHVQAAKLLLDRHADPNARALNGFTPLHIACKKNRIKVVELLLKYYASLEATTESGLSPLHVAAFMGCINIVIFLIQQGAKVDVETVRGETPLHLAARANQTDIVRVLVRNGAKVDAQARELQTPLHIASRLGNTDIVHILLNAHADPNAASRDEYTALHIAAKEDKEEVAQILLDHKANKTALTRKGFTPLHLASKYGNYNVAKLLLERGTPVDIEGKNKVTPLHVAAHYNNDRVAQLLLENGAFAQATAKNGYTPLHIAAKKNQMDIASALLSYKADPNARSKAGFTPLHLASESGHTEMTGLLIENGSGVNERANNGLTPLHLCAQEDKVDVARVLLSNGAEVNAQTKAGYTPLHVACHFGQLNMIRLLIEHGALVSAETTAGYTPLHQAAQQGHNNVVRYLLEHGASPNSKTVEGQTPLSIAQRFGYVSVVETLKTVTETTVITETTTVTEDRYKPQNPERMNETMFSDSEDEVDEIQASAQDHARDFNESITQGLHDSAVIHLIHTGEQMKSSAFDTTDADLDAVIKRAQAEPVTTAIPDPTFLDHSADDNVVITRDTVQPSKLFMKTFLISFLVDARGGAMRGCRHSGVRVIIPPRKAAAPMRITCRYLRKEKLAHPPPLSEGEALASRILEMGPHSAKFLGPVVLEVPHFASLRGREREIVILRSDDGQHWKEHQLEATEDAVQEVLNESFDAAELQQLDDLHSTRITRILTNDFPMYFAVVTRVRQEVHCVGPEGGVILSSVVPRVQAIFPDGSLTKTIKVSLQAQPVPNEIVVKLHGNRVAVSPIVTVEPRRRKFHKPITLCIPLPQSGNKGMLTQYNSAQPGQEPPTLRLLCSITGGSSPAQWEDITGTTQLTFTGEEVSFTTTVSARFWLMDCQTPRDAARMAQEVYNEAIAVPYMAKFVVFSRRPLPNEGQLRLFCMTDDREDKTLEKQEGFIEVAKSRDVEVLSSRHQFLEFRGNLVPITKSGDQLRVFFLPFQENRLAFNVKVRQHDDQEAATSGQIAIMKEERIRAENIPPQHPICTLSITLPDYRGQLPPLQRSFRDHQIEAIATKYAPALSKEMDGDLATQIDFVSRKIGGDWMRMSRSLGVSDADTRQIKRELPNQEPLTVLKIWSFVKSEDANVPELHQALRRIGRDDIVHKLQRGDLDSDSLRLIDSSNLHLDRTSITSRDDLRAAEKSPAAVDVQTTVTRTERRVHKSPDAAEPVVDERTITRYIRDNATVEEVVSERQSLPLNEFERDHWLRDPHEEPEVEEIFHNSREAMVLHNVQETPEGFVETTTLVTQHIIPEAEPTSTVVPEIQELEAQEEAGQPSSAHDSSPIVEEPPPDESPSDKLPTPQFEEHSNEMETSVTDSIIHHEDVPKAEPSPVRSVEHEPSPHHEDESPHLLQESVIEETEEEHEHSPAVASEREPHLRGEGLGDSIDVALEDRYSELSAILETTEPLSEPDSAAVQERDGADADEKTEHVDSLPTTEKLEETRQAVEEEAVPQSAELDTIVAGLTPSESEEVRAEVELIEESAQNPSLESVGSVDIEEILQKVAAEREDAQKEEVSEQPADRPQEFADQPADERKEVEQTEAEKQPEEPNQRPELEELIEQLTEGYDGAQQEIDAGSLGQSEDPELPEDAAADEFERPPSIEAEVQAAPPAEEPHAESTNPLVSFVQSALSALHISPRPGEEGFLEDAPLSDTSNPQLAVSLAVDSPSHEAVDQPKKTSGSESVSIVWAGVNSAGAPLISGLCVRSSNVSEEPTGADRSKPTDEPDRADDGGQGGGEIDDSKGENGDQPPPRDDHEPAADEKPEPPQADGEEQQQEGEKQAETSEKVELVSATPVEAAPDEAHESTASRPPPEPSAVSALLVPRSPAPFVPAAAAEEEKPLNADGELVVDIDAAAAPTAPIESGKPAGSAEPATVGDRPPPPPAANGEQTERKTRRSVDLPATPLSFHSFSSAAQLYAPVSPPLRQAIGAPEAPPPTADALKLRSIPDDSAAAAGVAPDQAGDQTDEAPRASNEVSRLLSGILTRLRHLQMTDPPKYANIVERLHALESEMSMQNTGVPPDPELTELVGRILASDYPQSDLQIVVNTSRKTTSTTQFYETETPGMVGLAPEQLRELQQKLINKISGTTDYGTALDSREQPDGLKHRNANEEGWTTGDGNETVTKRSIRQVTTTHSGITGAGDHELKDDSDTSSQSSVRDRIQRFESLKQTAAPAVHRTPPVVEERVHEAEVARTDEEHPHARPTEIDVKPQEEAILEPEAQEAAADVPETPTASVTVEELVEQIGSATTVSTPPKDAPAAAESPAEPRASVLSLIQKFSHPEEAGEIQPKDEEEHEQQQPIVEERTIVERWEFQPADHSQTITIEAKSERPVAEDVAQHMIREQPSTKTAGPVELTEEIEVTPAVSLAEQQAPRRVEPAQSIESEHDFQENDDYEHRPYSLDAVQHELPAERATSQTVSDKTVESQQPSEEFAVEEVPETSDESLRETRSIPIQQLASREVIEEERSTAEPHETHTSLRGTEEPTERNEPAAVTQEMTLEKEAEVPTTTHEVEHVSPVPSDRFEHTAHVAQQPQIDAHAGEQHHGRAGEDDVQFESTAHQETILIQGAASQHFVERETPPASPVIESPPDSAILEEQQDEEEPERPEEEAARSPPPERSRLAGAAALAAGAVAAAGAALLADRSTSEAEPSAVPPAERYDISPDHPKDFGEIEPVDMRKVTPIEPKVEAADARIIEEAEESPDHAASEFEQPAAFVREEAVEERHGHVEYPDEEEQTILKAPEVPDYDAPTELEYIPIERTAKEMIHGDLLPESEVAAHGSEISGSPSEQSIRSENTIIHVRSTEEPSEELVSTPETPRTELQPELPALVVGEEGREDVDVEAARSQERVPIHEAVVQEFVAQDIGSSVSAADEFAYEASPEDHPPAAPIVEEPSKPHDQEELLVPPSPEVAPSVEEEKTALPPPEHDESDVVVHEEQPSAAALAEEHPKSQEVSGEEHEEQTATADDQKHSPTEKVGLGTMIVGGAAMGAMKLFDAIRGEPKDEAASEQPTEQPIEHAEERVHEEQHQQERVEQTPAEELKREEREIHAQPADSSEIEQEELLAPPSLDVAPSVEDEKTVLPPPQLEESDEVVHEERPPVEVEERQTPDVVAHAEFEQAPDVEHSAHTEADVAVPEFAAHRESFAAETSSGPEVVEAPSASPTEASSIQADIEESPFTTEELHFEAREQSGQKPAEFHVEEVETTTPSQEAPSESPRRLTSEPKPREEEISAGFLQTEESPRATPVKPATIESTSSEVREAERDELQTTEMVEISPTDEKPQPFVEEQTPIVEIREHEIIAASPQAVAHLEEEAPGEDKPRTPTPDEYVQELAHEQEAEETAELVAEGIASLIVEEPKIEDTFHDQQQPHSPTPSEERPVDHDVEVRMEREPVQAEEIVIQTTIQDIPFSEITSERIEQPAHEPQEIAPPSPQFEEQLSERHERSAEDVYPFEEQQKEATAPAETPEGQPKTPEFVSKQKTPDEEVLHEVPAEESKREEHEVHEQSAKSPAIDEDELLAPPSEDLAPTVEDEKTVLPPPPQDESDEVVHEEQPASEIEKRKTPDEEVLHEYTRGSADVPPVSEYSAEFVQHKAKSEEHSDEHTPVVRDVESPQLEHAAAEEEAGERHVPAQPQPHEQHVEETTESPDQGSRMGIGTMILGAAALGAKAAIDKIADVLPHAQADEQQSGYQEISETYASTPSYEVPTESIQQQKVQEFARPTELVGEHPVEETDLDLQSPVSIASVPQDEVGRISQDPMQQSLYIPADEEDKVFGETPTHTESAVHSIIPQEEDEQKGRLESTDLMEQSIYEPRHEEEAVEQPTDVLKTPSPARSAQEGVEAEKREVEEERPLESPTAESHTHGEYAFTDDGERVESSSVVYTPEFEHPQFSVTSPQRVESVEQHTPAEDRPLSGERVDESEVVESTDISFGEHAPVPTAQQFEAKPIAFDEQRVESDELVESAEVQPQEQHERRQSPTVEKHEPSTPHNFREEAEGIVESEEISPETPAGLESPVLQQPIADTTKVEVEREDVVESEDLPHAAPTPDVHEHRRSVEQHEQEEEVVHPAAHDDDDDDDEEKPSGQKMGVGMMVAGAAVLGAQAVGEGIKKMGERIQQRFGDDGDHEHEEEAIVESEDYAPSEEQTFPRSELAQPPSREEEKAEEVGGLPQDVVESEEIRRSPEERLVSPTLEHEADGHVVHEEPPVPTPSEPILAEEVESERIAAPPTPEPSRVDITVDEPLVESEDIEQHEEESKRSSSPREVVITTTEVSTLPAPQTDAEQWSVESLKSFPMVESEDVAREPQTSTIADEKVAIRFVTDEEPIPGLHEEYVVESEAIHPPAAAEGRRFSTEINEQVERELPEGVVESEDVAFDQPPPSSAEWARPESPSVQEARPVHEEAVDVQQPSAEIVESESIETELPVRAEQHEPADDFETDRPSVGKFEDVVESASIDELPADRPSFRQSEVILDVGTLQKKPEQRVEEFEHEEEIVESEPVEEQQRVIDEHKPPHSPLAASPFEMVESEEISEQIAQRPESPRVSFASAEEHPIEHEQTVDERASPAESPLIVVEQPAAIPDDVVESAEIEGPASEQPTEARRSPVQLSRSEELEHLDQVGKDEQPRHAHEMQPEEERHQDEHPQEHPIESTRTEEEKPVEREATPEVPQQEELSEAIDEGLEEQPDNKIGLGTMLAGAVAMGAKAIGEKLEEFGDKIEEKFGPTHGDEEQRAEEAKEEGGVAEVHDETPAQPPAEQPSVESTEELRHLSEEAVEEYVLEPISPAASHKHERFEEETTGEVSESPLPVEETPLVTEPDAAMLKPAGLKETASNESLAGSEAEQSERIEQLEHPITSEEEAAPITGEEVTPSSESGVQPTASPTIQVTEAPVQPGGFGEDEEEVEILDDAAGYFAHSDEEVVAHEQPAKAPTPEQEVEEEPPTSHREPTPEEDFELVPRDEELITTESPDAHLRDSRPASESPTKPPSSRTSAAEGVEQPAQHEQQGGKEELVHDEADDHEETAERIAREAIESGTYESQFHMGGIQVPVERSAEQQPTAPSESPKEGGEEVDLSAEPPTRAAFDYARLLQERSDSAGTEMSHDRPFTSDDFGGDVPDLQEGAEDDDDDKPTVEIFDESRRPIAEEEPKRTSIRPPSDADEDELADFDVVEKQEAEEAAAATGGLAVEEPAARPRSPVPPCWQSVDQGPAEPPTSASLTPATAPDAESLAESAGSSADISVILVRKPGELSAHRKSDDGSESSLQEFERLELEIKQPIASTAAASATAVGTNGSPTSVGEEEVAEMVASATGSLNSLAEFENLEREVLEEQMTSTGAGAEVMILSDIREESEVEEMSVQEDNDEADSLSELQERAAAASDAAAAMITSADSLEPSAIPPAVEAAIAAAVAAGQQAMETSVDSLDGAHVVSHTDDSLLEGVSHQEGQSQDTQAALSQDTAATFQEYHEDDRDSLEGVIEDYPTTLTTYETIQTTDDGSTETITRRVLTRVTDPVHSHIRFTGTENEDRLRNIQPEERVQSVDEEGNITTTVRRRTPTLP